jgi:hypothetical protein
VEKNDPTPIPSRNNRKGRLLVAPLEVSKNLENGFRMLTGLGMGRSELHKQKWGLLWLLLLILDALLDKNLRRMKYLLRVSISMYEY